MKLDPRHLAQLSVVVEAGSFQAAAERLGTTQPALSRNIKTLEMRLGGSVFDRTGRRAVPTELGRRMARTGLSIRQAQERAESYADLSKAGLAGELRIGAPPIVAGRFLTSTLTSILKDNPECVVELRVGLVHELRALLDRGRIDLVIGPRSLVESAAGLVFELIVDDSVGILCRRGHPLTQTGKPSPGDLEQQRWVAHSRGSLLRQQTESGLMAFGLDNIHIACETDSIRTVFDLVEKTDLISTMPRESTKPYLEKKFVFLDLDQPQFHRPIGAIRRRDQQISELEKLFVTKLVERQTG
ncbi:MAG: LysR family transcriptional regulator [Pseudomonadota bacterium]